MLMIVMALLSSVFCGLCAIGLLISGGPTVWFVTAVFSLWLGGRVWRWMQKTTPIDPEILFPPGSPLLSRSSD